MNREEAETTVRAILETIHEATQKAGRGAVKDLAETLGRDRTFLSQWRRRNSLAMVDFLLIASAMGEDPGRFLGRVVRAARRKRPVEETAKPIRGDVARASRELNDFCDAIGVEVDEDDGHS